MKQKFSVEEFKKVRGKGEFGEWLRELTEDSNRKRHLIELGKHVILPQFHGWKNPLLIEGREGNRIKTSEGALEDWGAGAYWTGIFAPERFSACLFNDTLSAPAVLLALKLLHLSGMDMVAYGTTGSDAIDLAIRLSWQYRRQLSGNLEKGNICSIRGCYHGSTGLALYISGDPDGSSLNYAEDMPPVGWVTRLSDPAKNPEWFRDFEHMDLKRTAAFFYEPVMGARGIWPTLAGIRHIMPIARRNEILMVADEVCTAPARTGRMFASQYLEEMPDMICTAKGITKGDEVLSIVLINEKIAGIIRKFEEYRYGHTLGGHPEACKKALDVLGEVEKIDAPTLARDSGDYFLAKLKELEGLPGVVEARGIGLMLGIEFKKSFLANLVAEKLKKLGVFLTTEGNTVAVMPRLNIEKKEIDSFCNTLKSAILSVNCIENMTAPELVSFVRQNGQEETLLELIDHYLDSLGNEPRLYGLAPPHGVSDCVKVRESRNLEFLKGNFLVLFVDGNINGLINYERYDNDVCELHFVINSGFQGLGYGTKMYGELIGAAKTSQAERLVVYNMQGKGKRILERVAASLGLEIKAGNENGDKKYVIELLTGEA